jgi:hypothetical protein
MVAYARIMTVNLDRCQVGCVDQGQSLEGRNLMRMG